MNGAPAIEFDGVWKAFKRHSGRALLRTHLVQFLRGRVKPAPPFHALKNITFRMQPGESVAVLGANGAGKSTLLSLVAGLVPPDRGRVLVNGRVSPLLELGSGFNTDLTGTENLRLYASLLGIRRRRLSEITPAIIEFAELGDFMDEPLRALSTGMVMRLAFSVAIHADPDILLIDEVMAVGDARFQEKCREALACFRRAGKSLLFVSHSAPAVREMCRRALWIDQGALMMDGDVDAVLEAYEGRAVMKQPG